MTRETKIGLFVGMMVIILIGILISDHLSTAAQKQHPAELAKAVTTIDPETAPAPPGNIPELRPAISVSPATRDISTPLPGRAGDGAIDPTSFVRQGDSNNITDAPGRKTIPGFEAVPTRGGVTPREPADRFTPVPPAAPKQVFHFVKEHETLSAISQVYYGDRTHAQAIYEANKDKMANVNSLRPDVRLLIPNPTRGVATPATPINLTSDPVPPTDNGPTPTPEKVTADKVALIDYKVAEGDTLASIAQRYYGSQGAWQKLYALNKEMIPNPNRLRPGTTIKVPKN